MYSRVTSLNLGLVLVSLLMTCFCSLFASQNFFFGRNRLVTFREPIRHLLLRSDSFRSRSCGHVDVFGSFPSRLRRFRFRVVATVVMVFRSVETLISLKYLKKFSLNFVTDSFVDIFVADAAQQSLTVGYGLVVVAWCR